MVIAKYIKRLDVVEALLWTGRNHSEMFDFLGENDGESLEEGCFYFNHHKVHGGLVIKTPEGERIVNKGDYIIRNQRNEYCPCQACIFEKTYEQI